MTRAQIIDKAVALAKAELGTYEVGENRGTRVGQYQAATTLGGTGWPWCAALLAFVIRHTESACGIDIPWSFSASCDVLWADGRARGLVRSVPEKGDIFIVKARKGFGYSTADGIHTGIITAVNGANFKTIEGNTNNSGGREGVAVMEHTRQLSNRFAYIRWIDGVKLPDVVEPKPWAVSAYDSHGVKYELKAILIDGTNYIPVREFGDAIGVPTSYDSQDGEIGLKGEPIATQPRLIGGKAYFAIRTLAEHVGMQAKADGATRIVEIR